MDLNLRGVRENPGALDPDASAGEWLLEPPSACDAASDLSFDDAASHDSAEPPSDDDRPAAGPPGRREFRVDWGTYRGSILHGRSATSPAVCQYMGGLHEVFEASLHPSHAVAHELPLRASQNLARHIVQLRSDCMRCGELLS